MIFSTTKRPWVTKRIDYLLRRHIDRWKEHQMLTTTTYLEKGNGFSATLSNHQCVLCVSRQCQCHNNKEFNRTDQEEFSDFMFAMNRKNSLTNLLPPTRLIG